mgnify:CR=1 FL=1
MIESAAINQGVVCFIDPLYAQKCRDPVKNPENPLLFRVFGFIMDYVKFKIVLRGGVKVPTGGIVRERPLAADPVGSRDRQLQSG